MYGFVHPPSIIFLSIVSSASATGLSCLELGLGRHCLSEEHILMHNLVSACLELSLTRLSAASRISLGVQYSDDDDKNTRVKVETNVCKREHKHKRGQSAGMGQNCQGQGICLTLSWSWRIVARPHTIHKDALTLIHRKCLSKSKNDPAEAQPRLRWFRSFQSLTPTPFDRDRD